MHFLVINLGSSSVKYSVFDEQERVVKSGELPRIQNVQNTAVLAKQILRAVGNITEISVVIHRIVHGGDEYDKPCELTKDILAHLARFNSLAPLHNPPALALVEAFREYMPNVRHFGVFDSAFFSDLPTVAREYALPRTLTERFSIRRYGFHGISHGYAYEEARKKLSSINYQLSNRRNRKQEFTCISLHLGSGCSAALIRDGKPLDISMGFTPLEGLPMMTRTGDLDVGAVLYVLRQKEKVFHEGVQVKFANNNFSARGGSASRGQFSTLDQLEKVLNEESGLQAFAGTADFREILNRASSDPEARFALEFFVYHIRKYIGAYMAVAPNSVDAIVLTGAIGAGDPRFRKMLLKNFPLVRGIPVVVVKPNEALACLREARRGMNFQL